MHVQPLRPPVLLALLLALLLLAAACTADPATAPPGGAMPGVAPPTLAIGVTYPAACEPSTIRQTMATLYTVSDLKKEGLPTFNRGEQLRQAGDLAAARSEYFRLIDHLLRTFRANRLQQPSQLASVQDGVYYVVAGVSRCAGDPEIDDLATFIVGIGNGAKNYEICVVRATSRGAECAVPSMGAAVKLDAGYLWQEALILLQPDLADAEEDLFEPDLGTTWSDVWRLRIEPVTAQRSYPQTPMPPAVTPTPYGHAAVCTIEKYDLDPHQKLTHDGLLRLGYSEGEGATAVLLEAWTPSAGLIDCKYYSMYWQQGVGTSSLGATPVLDAWPARVAMSGLRRAAARALELLAPQPLYAFDGGIGGRFTSTRSFFAAAETPRVYVRRDPSAVSDGPVPTLQLRALASTSVLASRTSYGLVRTPGSCSWASSHVRVSVTPSATDDTRATLTASRSTGTAVVTATCTRDGVTASYATTVTVVR